MDNKYQLVTASPGLAKSNFPQLRRLFFPVPVLLLLMELIPPPYCSCHGNVRGGTHYYNMHPDNFDIIGPDDFHVRHRRFRRDGSSKDFKSPLHSEPKRLGESHLIEFDALDRSFALELFSDHSVLDDVTIHVNGRHTYRRSADNFPFSTKDQLGFLSGQLRSEPDSLVRVFVAESSSPAPSAKDLGHNLNKQLPPPSPAITMTGYILSNGSWYGLEPAPTEGPGRTLVYALGDVAKAHSNHIKRNLSRTSSLFSSARAVPGSQKAPFCGSSPDLILKLLEANRTASVPESEGGEMYHGSERLRRDTSLDTCSVRAVADSLFSKQYQGNIAEITKMISFTILFANDILRGHEIMKADTKIRPGVQLSKLDIYTNSEDDILRKNKNIVTAENLLIEASKKIALGESCIGLIYTHQDFSEGTQGLAFVGDPSIGSGICHGHGKVLPAHYNVGLSSSINFGTQLSTSLLSMIVTHEIGHLFGSPHDPAFCSPGIKSTQGNFLMNRIQVDGSKKNNRIFSECSLNAMVPVVTANSNCFSTKSSHVCGNGILEGDEECDSGFSGDKCCTSACKLNQINGITVQCSDFNHGCCQDCEVVSGKICFEAFEGDLQCRETAICSGKDKNCPAPVYKPEGLRCGASGICKGDVPICVSACPGLGAKECLCSDTDTSCTTCCINNETNPKQYCERGFTYTEVTYLDQNNVERRDFKCSNHAGIVKNPTTLFPDCLSATERMNKFSLISIDGSNRSKHHDKYLADNSSLLRNPGSVCSINGLCDSSGLCIRVSNVPKVAQDNYKSAQKALTNWMTNNYVGMTMLFTTCVWSAATWKIMVDNRKRKKKLEQKKTMVDQHRIDVLKRGKSMILESIA